MFYVVYKTTNLINGKIYIGAHQTNDLDDGYLGSGYLMRYAINKYGPESFQKEILHLLDCKSEMYNKERELVTEEFVKLKTNYNVRVGGKGGWTDEQQQENKRRSLIKLKQLWETDVEWATKQRERFSSQLREQYKTKQRVNTTTPHIPGEYKHTDDAKKSISEGRQGKGIGNTNRAEPIIDDGGMIHNSIVECARYYGVRPESIVRRIKKGLYQKIGRLNVQETYFPVN
ncbi:MAG: hypothetical protein CTY12_01275 [Methylotenera sp.]|nr:MAG: hypothetical protein CTY12_01275 [Methylotenera sp.]